MNRFRTAGFVLLGSLLLAAGCNQIAGIDEPVHKADGGGGAGGTGGTGGNGTGATGMGGSGGAMSVCGDGQVTGAEQCDDGDADEGDGCGADCMIEPGWACSGEPSMCAQTCGNGVIDANEQCDDGGIQTDDGCNQGCQVEAGWECEGEPSACHFSCGDGTLDMGEQCDDGGLDAKDGCDAACQAEPGWDCKQPAGPDNPSDCATVCGDGIIAGAEVCDDANTSNADGCSADCKVVGTGWDCDPVNGGPTSCTSICGDGIALIGYEECDDGGQINNDGCSSACILEHFCGNGIIDPTEECDGGTGCTNCQLDAGNVCGDAPEILPGNVDSQTGVRKSYIEGDNSAAGSTISTTAVLAAGCHVYENVVLYKYQTGATPSIVTVEALDKLADGTTTFLKSVAWIYRDCLNKAEREGCDDNAGAGDRPKVSTGYIPANTTLFIVFAGEGGNEKGPYRLEVTEQPVKLFFHETFGNEVAAGEYPLPATLSQTLIGDGGWSTCVAGGGSPCFGVSLPSHSRGAFGYAKPWVTSSSIKTTATLTTTPSMDLSGLTLARMQYVYNFINGAGLDFGEVTPYDNMVAGAKTTYSGANTQGRAYADMPKSSKASVQFTYDDDANSGAGKFFIDDIIIYGY